MLSEEMSLWEFCSKCSAFCCSGTPRVSERELREILKKVKKNHFRKEGLGYYVTKQKNGMCAYLKEGKCSIQHAKPIDCMLFPTDPFYGEDGSISFVVETSCPAARNLPKEFVEKAKEIGKEWIKETSLEQFKDYWKKYKDTGTIEKMD